MKILFISNLYPKFQDQSINETSYALHDFVKIWKQNHYEVIVINPNKIINKQICKNIIKKNNKFVLDDVSIYNEKILSIPKLEKIYIGNLIRLLQKLNFNPDCIVAHMYYSYNIAYSLSKKIKKPYVLGVHNSDLSVNKNKMKKFQKAHFIFRSPSLKKHFENKFFKVNSSFIANSGIICNEIESKKFFDKKINCLNTKIKKGQQINICTVAVLQKLKNIDTNLEALSKLKNINWQYTIIGDGSELEFLKKKVIEYKLEKKVVFKGSMNREDVLNFLKFNCDLFVMISAPETFGLVYLEALAKGNVVFYAKGWGIDGILSNRISGFEAIPCDSLSLYNQLKYFFQQNAQSRNYMSNQAYEIITTLTQEKMSLKYIENIKEYIDE